MDGLAPHGTPGAYKRHLRNKESACDICRAAHTERCRKYKSTTRARAAAATAAYRAKVALDNAAKAEDYRFLIETGCTHPEMIARRMGYRSVEALQAFCRRNGLPWVDALDVRRRAA